MYYNKYINLKNNALNKQKVILNDKNLCINQIRLINNFTNYNYNIIKCIEQLFYNKINYKNITKNNLLTALSYKIYHRTNLNFQQNKKIHDLIKEIELKINHKFIDNMNYNQDFIKVAHNNFMCWYQPLFLILFKNILKWVFHLWMVKNFNYEVMENNYVIYHSKKIDPNKKTLILFHCSIAGGLSLIKFISKIINNYNLIIPEIPGYSWNYYYNDMNNIYDMEFYNEQLINFIDNKFNNIRFNLISHSLGGITCIKFYYQYKFKLQKNNLISKIIFIESPILPFNTYKLHCESYDLKTLLNNYSVFDILSIPFLQRDLYVQYYINKNVNNLNCSYYFDDDNIESHVVLVEKDNKIPTEYYKYFLEKKNLDKVANLKIFNNYTHGSFLINNEIQNYIIKILN